MHAGEAEHTIREIERVRRETRRTLHPLWYANIVVAVFFLGATLVGALAESAAPPIAYWAIGVPAALGLIVHFDMRHERALGAEARLADPAIALLAGTAIVAIEPSEPWVWAQLTMALLLFAAGGVERAWEQQ